MGQTESACERDNSSNATRELSECALREMLVRNLRAAAETAGVTLVVEGDHLRLRGPKKAEALGRLLLERKTEVLATLTPARSQTAEASVAAESLIACEPAVITASNSWDAERTTALIAEVDAQIEAALVTALLPDQPARRNELANERQIVRRLAQHRDPFLWQWPQALHRLLARWNEQDAQRHS